ncbi:MAG: D-2-hydroxyacid dehydrogenase [Clostridia bacterium]|nr:D-2-hydroxyacid dehydrogenase [Clostridia bacterium]
MMRILASDGMEKNAVAALQAQGHEVVEQFYEPAELAEQVKNFDVLVVRSATKVREPIIDAALETGKLKLIIRGGVGIDNIDHKYAEEKGIAVRNTPRASSDAVAELALAHMLSCARFVSHAGHSMREGKWEKKAYAKGIEVGGKTLGVIGYGRIGQSLGRMAQALGMKVLAFDIYHVEGIENENMKYVEMDELFAKSDFISIHTPAIDGKPLINAETIAKMKDGVNIINTSRGANIDEAALLEALNSGKVRSAGLDVWAEEPSKNDALYNHPMVSCTPHIGASTVEAQKRIGAEIVDIIGKFFA